MVPIPSHQLSFAELYQEYRHLRQRCKLWATTWQKEMGWAPEAG
jgi:hypothetical protein